MQNERNSPPIGFVGFGEAARAIVAGWGPETASRVRAYDLKLEVAEERHEIVAAAKILSASTSPTLEELFDGPAGMVFCLVTADQAAAAAETAARIIPPGTIWIDGNSCAPGTKRRAAAVIEQAGGRYVDLAIMAPILPRGHRTPMLVAGPHAAQARDMLRAFDMDVEIAGDRVGDASSIKMIRSVMIKGLEALTAECLLAARRAGVEEQVLASFEASDPGLAWRKRSLYNLGRMSEHGTRRAAEMREVALTLGELGLPARMSAAASAWQEQIGDLELDLTGELLDALDQTLAALDR